MSILTKFAHQVWFVIHHGRPRAGLTVRVSRVQIHWVTDGLDPRGRSLLRVPEWSVPFENLAPWPRQEFAILRGYPPAIPSALRVEVGRWEGFFLFYAIDLRAREVQWVSPCYKAPWAGWQLFFLRGLLWTLANRRLLCTGLMLWFWKAVGVGLVAVGGPLSALWLARVLGW